MSNMINFLSKILLLLLCFILLNPHDANITKGCSTTLPVICVAAAAARPLEQEFPKYTNLKVADDQKGHNGRISSGNFQGGGGRNVEACLPKGFRRSSAPSRYINYQPLAGSTCSSAKVVVNGPSPP